MPIAKGRPWGAPGPLPEGAVLVRSDAEARAAVEEARKARRPPPPLGLLGGDLCRTLGGTGDERRLFAGEATCFRIDLGEVLLDGRFHAFVAHLVARSRAWTRAFVAMNAQWLGSWNAGPRAHPNDGIIDTYDVHLRLGQLAAVRARLHHGAHLPHPGIREERAPAVQAELERPLQVWLDGAPVGRARKIAVRVDADAVLVAV